MQNPFQLIAGYLQFHGTYSFPLHHLFLMVLVLVATTVDIRERRIPNWLVGVGMISGLLFHSSAPHGMGMFFALSGLGIGIGTLFPLFALRMLGAGDVKLVGMIGAFLGVTGVLGTILATVIAGGILALGIATWKRALPQILVNLRLLLIQRQIWQGEITGSTTLTDSSVGKMPYAVAICAGTLTQLFVLRY